MSTKLQIIILTILMIAATGLQAISNKLHFVDGLSSSYNTSSLLYNDNDGDTTKINRRYYFIDSTDNALDFSGFLNTAAGFLPVPIVVTEPAVGLGAGLGAVFIHSKKKRLGERKKGQFPPIVSVAGGLYTSNDTWLALLAHQASYYQDRLRYTGALSYMSVNIAFYKPRLIQEEIKFDVNMKGGVIFQELLFRVKKKFPLFTGLNYVYFNSDITLKTQLNHPELGDITQNTQLGGTSAILLWDTRNNIFNPTKGIMTAFEWGLFSPKLGSDTEFSSFMNRTYLYTEVFTPKLVAGFRFHEESKWGDVPFYALPFISMRGIPAMRYQDYHALTLETEWRWNVVKRWSLVGFIGSGYSAPTIDSFDFSEGKVAGGLGFRYLIARDYKTHAGLDFAKGPEIWAWYITVGSSWPR